MPGRAGLSPTMVGRSAVFEELVDAIDSGLMCCNDAPVIVLVSGEAGIGKTRLVREALAHFPSAITFAAAAEQTDSAASIVGDAAASAGGVAREAEPETIAAALAARLSVPTGAVVVIDDVHWIDGRGAGVVDRLSRLATGGLVLILTFRPDELNRKRPGGDLVTRIERRQAVARVHLERLDRNDVGAFLRSALGRSIPASAVAAVHERTGGNPFAIEELARTYGARLDELASGALPWTLAEVVGGRLDGLDRDQRAVIEAAAICGIATSFDLLTAVVGLDESALIDVLRTLVDRDLLEERADDQFAFRHALVRDAVTRRLLGRQRRRLHARVLEWLGDSDELARRAHHAHAAGQLEAFVALARRAAADALQRGASFDALRLATEALVEEPDDAELLLIAAESSWLIGAFDETASAADHLRQLAERDADPERLAAAMRWVVRAAFEQERFDDMDRGVVELEQLLDVLPAGQPRAATLVAVAQSHMLRHRGTEAVEWADRAMADAEQLGLDHLAIQARLERASALGNTGHLDHADTTRSLLDAIDEAEAAELWTLAARGINNVLASIPAYTADGRRLLDRFRAAARLGGYDWMGTAMLTFREAEVALGESDMPALRRTMARAGEFWTVGSPKSIWLEAGQVELALEEGCQARARQLLDALGPARCAEEVWRGAFEVRVAALDGDPSVTALFESLDLGAHQETPLVREVVLVAEAALGAGVAPARVRRKLLDDLLDGKPGLHQRAAPVVEGLAAVADGRFAEGAAALTAAVADPDDQFPRHLIAGLRMQLAGALYELGRRDEALAALDTTLAELANWPGWRRDRTEAMKRRWVGRAAPTHAGELTARERDVAMLLAEGLTNGQIAKRLYISPKTASVHVSNILMKLNMSTRSEVAAWAVRTGLAAAS